MSSFERGAVEGERRRDYRLDYAQIIRSPGQIFPLQAKGITAHSSQPKKKKKEKKKRGGGGGKGPTTNPGRKSG